MKVALSLLLLKVAAVVAKPQKPRVLAACLEADKNQPLVEPRVIQSDEDELRFELNIAAGSVGDLLPCGIRFRSRLYEGTFPGPTIMTRRGQLVNMSLINHLGPEDPNVPVVPNFFHTPNTTNLHIHFIHASPGGSQDNVMRKLVPGQTLEYSFPLHEEHASGTGFYHPHYHGSVYYQMYNGMAGAWIMQDEADREYEQAPELEAMTEHVLVLQDLDLGRHEDIMKMDNQLSGDQRYQWWARGGGPHSNMPIDFENPNNLNFRLLLVNGQYNPKTTLRKGEIKRLRLVNALTTDSVHFMFDAPGCRLWELAKDSIYLNKPMEASSVFIAAGSRVDVAARCDGDDIEVGQLVQLLSDHDESQLHIGSPLDDGQQFLTGYIWSTIAFVPDHESKTNQAIVTFEITQEGEPMYLPSKLPSLPSYTQRLIDESAATETLPDELIKELVFAGPATIYDRPEDFHRGVLRMEFRDVNHMLYNDTILLWNQTLGMLDEWVSGLSLHLLSWPRITSSYTAPSSSTCSISMTHTQTISTRPSSLITSTSTQTTFS